MVQVLGNCFILERFLLHDVTPVTGRVADREQDRFIVLLGPVEGFVAPGVPVDRVMGMLQEVGARFQQETVRVLRGPIGAYVTGARFIMRALGFQGLGQALLQSRGKCFGAGELMHGLGGEGYSSQEKETYQPYGHPDLCSTS